MIMTLALSNETKRNAPHCPAAGFKLQGMVHRSELSWDAFLTVDQVAAVGQKMALKVRLRQRPPTTVSRLQFPWNAAIAHLCRLHHGHAAILRADVKMLCLASQRMAGSFQTSRPSCRAAAAGGGCRPLCTPSSNLTASYFNAVWKLAVRLPRAYHLATVAVISAPAGDGGRPLQVPPHPERQGAAAGPPQADH